MNIAHTKRLTKELKAASKAWMALYRVERRFIAAWNKCTDDERRAAYHETFGIVVGDNAVHRLSSDAFHDCGA